MCDFSFVIREKENGSNSLLLLLPLITVQLNYHSLLGGSYISDKRAHVFVYIKALIFVLSFIDSMQKIDGFQTTDSFRFDRNSSNSYISLSSSSGYGSRLSLSQTDHSSSSSSNRRIGITKYFKEKLSRHKSLASLLLSSPSTTTPIRTEINQHNTDIYDNVWNLDEQIEKLRLTVNKQIPLDSQSIISMSVDIPIPVHHRIE
jgi:hypothetical protein